MSVIEHPDFDNHEYVSFHNDPETGLSAIIAVHNTRLGPGLGGCRMYPYPDSKAALTDVLRLSKGMTYKAAMASLPLGGGKSVIIGDPRKGKPPAMMHAMGRFVEKLGGAYVVAEDSGISVADVIEMSQHTLHVGGIRSHHQFDGKESDGNPAPATAFGVFTGIQAAVAFRFGSSLNGKTVALAGLGHVGMRLSRHLHEAGAHLIVADILESNTQQAKNEFDAEVVPVEQIDKIKADVFSPCALGNAINHLNIDSLNVPIVAGAANNQLECFEIGVKLHQKGILYAPDYVINAGGIIDIHHQKQSSPAGVIKAHLESVGETLTQIFERAESSQTPTHQIADQMAEEKFKVF